MRFLNQNRSRGFQTGNGITILRTGGGYSEMQLVDSIQNKFDFLFPSFCLVCDDYLQSTEDLVCQECWNDLQPARAVADDFKNTEYIFDDIIFLGQFNDVLRPMVHALKYGRYLNFLQMEGYKRLGFKLGRLLGDRIKKRNIDGLIDAIIPVPLYSSRGRERGYNQCEVIAEGVSAQINRPLIVNNLIRSRATRSQVGLDQHQRRQNVKNAFHLKRADEIVDKKILIIDDVFTTGATVTECGQVLRDQGQAKLIWAAVVGRA